MRSHERALLRFIREAEEADFNQGTPESAPPLPYDREPVFIVNIKEYDEVEANDEKHNGIYVGATPEDNAKLKQILKGKHVLQGDFDTSTSKIVSFEFNKLANLKIYAARKNFEVIKVDKDNYNPATARIAIDPKYLRGMASELRKDIIQTDKEAGIVTPESAVAAVPAQAPAESAPSLVTGDANTEPASEEAKIFLQALKLFLGNVKYVPESRFVGRKFTSYMCEWYNAQADKCYCDFPDPTKASHRCGLPATKLAIFKYLTPAKKFHRVPSTFCDKHNQEFMGEDFVSRFEDPTKMSALIFGELQDNKITPTSARGMTPEIAANIKAGITETTQGESAPPESAPASAAAAAEEMWTPEPVEYTGVRPSGSFESQAHPAMIDGITWDAWVKFLNGNPDKIKVDIHLEEAITATPENKKLIADYVNEIRAARDKAPQDFDLSTLNGKTPEERVQIVYQLYNRARKVNTNMSRNVVNAINSMLPTLSEDKQTYIKSMLKQVKADFLRRHPDWLAYVLMLLDPTLGMMYFAYHHITKGENVQEIWFATPEARDQASPVLGGVKGSQASNYASDKYLVTHETRSESSNTNSGYGYLLRLHFKESKQQERGSTLEFKKEIRDRLNKVNLRYGVNYIMPDNRSINKMYGVWRDSITENWQFVIRFGTQGETATSGANRFFTDNPVGSTRFGYPVVAIYPNDGPGVLPSDPKFVMIYEYGKDLGTEDIQNVIKNIITHISTEYRRTPQHSKDKLNGDPYKLNLDFYVDSTTLSFNPHSLNDPVFFRQDAPAVSSTAGTNTPPAPESAPAGTQ